MLMFVPVAQRDLIQYLLDLLHAHSVVQGNMEVRWVPLLSPNPVLLVLRESSRRLMEPKVVPIAITGSSPHMLD